MDERTPVQGVVSVQLVDHNSSLGEGCIPLRLNATEHLPWASPGNIASQEVEAYASQIKDLALAFCFLIGGPANVINMAVFFKQGLQDRVNLCLFSLALFDELYLLAGFLVHAENIYLYLSFQPVKAPASKFMTNNNLVVFIGSAFVSFILSAIIACERCYCVLRPLKYQTLLSTRTMAGIIASISLCVYSLYFIVSYRYWVHCVYDPITQETMIKITGGEFYQTHQQLVDFLDGFVFGAVLPGGSVIMVTTATTITTAKLRRVVTWRTETSSSLSPREVALTKMLIGISLFFITCTSPSCVFRVACLFLPEMSAGGQYHNFYFTTVWVLEGFAFINSSFNFFVYYSMGTRYRDTFWALFSRRNGQKG